MMVPLDEFAPMIGDELFYKDKDGKKQAAALHESILAGGDHAKAQQVGIEAARRAGLTEEQIAKLYAPVDTLPKSDPAQR